MLDYRLTQHRTVPINHRLCLESIEELANEARATIRRAKTDGRELFAHEAERFDEITQIEIPAWKREAEHAAAWQESVKTSVHNRFETQV